MFTAYRFNSILGMLLIQVVLYTVIEITTFLAYKIRGNQLLASVVVSKLITPLSLLYLMIFPLVFAEKNSNALLCFSVVFLVVINIFALIYSDKTKKFIEANTEKEILAYRSRLYESQLNLIKESTLEIRKIKHDFANHLTAITALIAADNREDALNYTDKIIQLLGSKTPWSKTGNITIDSIINYKLKDVEEKNIKVQCNIWCPEDISIDPFDITVIIGNLLDNAIEALDKVNEDNRVLDIILKYDRGRFFLKLENTFDGTILKCSNTPETRKSDHLNHGIGLENVKSAISKYQGNLDISITADKFTAKVMLFV